MTGDLAGRRVVAVAAGYSHTLVLCDDGAILGWGNNSYGQLGNTGRNFHITAVLLEDLGALAGREVVAIAAGQYCNLALCADGTVAGWGNNDSGQLGDGTTVTSRRPVAVSRTGALADRKITDKTRIQTRGYLTLGSTRFYDWNHIGFGLCTIYCGFGHSSDTFFFQMAGKLGIDRLGYWAKQYGFGKPTGIDLPGEVSGIVPTNQWKMDALGAKIFPGETYQAGIGQGYDVVTPIQLINAYAALANGGTLHQPQIVRDIVGPDGKVVRPFKPKVLHKMKVSGSVLKIMRNAARSTVLLRHTYNLVDLPIKVAGKSGTAEFGTRDSKGRLPFHSWFVGFVPKDARHGSFNGTDSPLVVLAFAYDSRTKGNVATEIVKYFMQMHFGIKKDYRLPDLLKRGNFYQSN
jgi:hypothetical protein